MKPVGKEKTENSGQASNENTNQESGKSINLDLSKIKVEHYLKIWLILIHSQNLILEL